MTRLPPVAVSIPIPGSGDRVVLFRWGLDETARLENVARLDEAGNLVWRAELPGSADRDCFVTLRRCGNGLVARTYAGFELRFGFDGVVEQHEAA